MRESKTKPRRNALFFQTSAFFRTKHHFSNYKKENTMSIQICGAPCCWGVDDPKNPYLPPWRRVLKEAGLAGYSAIELGPYGYLPIDVPAVSTELRKTGLPL